MSQDSRPRALNGPGDDEFFLQARPGSKVPSPVIGGYGGRPSYDGSAYDGSAYDGSGYTGSASGNDGQTRPTASSPALPHSLTTGSGRSSRNSSDSAVSAAHRRQAQQTPAPVPTPPGRQQTGPARNSVAAAAAAATAGYAAAGEALKRAKSPEYGRFHSDNGGDGSRVPPNRPMHSATVPTIGRFSSTASTSTVRAHRSSPPPPETPITGPEISGQSGIEARFANMMGGGSGSTTSAPPRRPWTPTEDNGSTHGPWTVYQGGTAIEHPPDSQDSPVPAAPLGSTQGRTTPGASGAASGRRPDPADSSLESAIDRLAVSGDEPPPEYSTVMRVDQPGQTPQSLPRTATGYVDEKAALQEQQQRNFEQDRLAGRTPVAADAAAAPMHPSGLAQQLQPAAGPATMPVPVQGQNQPVQAQPALQEASWPGGPAAAISQFGPGGESAYAGPSQFLAPGLSAQPGPSPVPFGPVGNEKGKMGLADAPHPAFTQGMLSPSVAPGSGMMGSLPLASPSAAPASAQTLTAPMSAISGVSSPPPLPEGWIAHVDASSGQYYYIHIATQATQWEFPKGPTPLNFKEQPMSPAMSMFGSPLSPGPMSAFGSMMPMSPGKSAFGDGITSVAGLGSPAMSTMSSLSAYPALPPTSGIELYKIQPANGVYFGPYLRYTNMDIERGMWLGSILLVTDGPQAPTVHIHKTVDLAPNPRQLQSNPIYTHQRWMFYRYDVDLAMDEDGSTKWTYAITSHLGCTRYEFVVAGRHEHGWRFIAHSGNDFALALSAEDRVRLGGVDGMWKDVLRKHVDCNGFHVQLGLGNQIFADRMWKEIPLLREWTAMSGKDRRKSAPWTARHGEDVTHAYFHYYTSHFDQPHIREAFAQIPHVLALDGHDIFDGFGSYPDHMQLSNMFQNIGRIATDMYLLFQHHTTVEILRNVSNDLDLFTVTGTGWHFVKFLGPAIAVVGPDTRSERTPTQVMAGATWQGLFPKVAMLPPSVQHCIWAVPVPVVYPRLESVEQFAHTVATGKKAVTGTFNMLGRVTSSVAGVVGARSVVGEGFNSVKKAVGKSGLMSNVLSPFGEIDILDELRDQWTHDSKDLERTYLIRTLQGIAKNKSIRFTFFSGNVNCCGAGLLHDPGQPGDHKSMYQVISSSIVNGPPSGYFMRMLHSPKELYVPGNGHKSSHQPSDTKEDMMEIFATDVNGAGRDTRRLMGRRNYVACVAFDPQLLQQQMLAPSSAFPLSPQQNMFAPGSMPGAQKLAMAGATGAGPTSLHVGDGAAGSSSGRLSIAVDFLVQGDPQGVPVKYGPVVIPGLEFGQ